MDFHHPEDRQALADTLGRYLFDRYTFTTRDRIALSDAGWSAEHWRALADLGIVGALFGEHAGGYGGDAFDIGVVYQAIGKALVVEPFLGTLMAGRAIEAISGPDDLLGEVIAGGKILAFAHQEPLGRYAPESVQTSGSRSGGGWTLSGAKAVIPHLEAADAIVVSARTDGEPGDPSGISLFLVRKDAPGLSVRGYPMIDGGRGGELTLSDTPATLLGQEHGGFDIVEAVIAAGNVALAWEAVGVMDALKTATLDFLRLRKQFGVAIGKFQVLQHRMATLALEIEQARSAAINAAAVLHADRTVRERAISAAKYTIGRVGTLVAEEVIQLHGGIGMTWELPLSHHAKRLTMIGHQLGDEDYHLE
ncbi:MAG: acyl-CoA dehydrogenase protein, partial [Rhizorhabdus sp.]|nr:acyl-CoA dehydrogenase protein [Rhizorhabdus sp.]